MKIIEKKIMVVIILASFIMPLHYAFWIFYPPEDTVFNGYDEGEAVQYTVLKSVNMNFENPWVLDNEPVPKKIFFMPFLGSVYILAFLGIITVVFSIPILLVYIIFRFFASFFFLLFSYYLIGCLTKDKKEQNTTFLLFAFSAGITGIFQIYKILDVTTISLFGMGVGPYKFIGYYTALSAAFGIASIYFLIRNKPLLTGFFIGMATLTYPLHGFAAFMINLIYIILNYENKIMYILKTAVPAIPFALAWVLPYLIDNTFFVQYFSQNATNSVVFPPSVVLGLGSGAAFILYELYYKFGLKAKKLKGNLYIILVLFSFVLFSIAHLNQPAIKVINPNFPSIVQKYGFDWLLKLSSDFEVLFEIPFILLMIYFTILSVRTTDKKEYKFVTIWFFLLMLLAFTPTKYTGLYADKYLIFFYIPALILSAKGVLRFSCNHSINFKKIILLIIILSMPSILLINLYTQILPRESYINNPSQSAIFYSTSEYKALSFLEKQPYGVVVSSERISLYLPYYSAKKSLLFDDKRFAYDTDIKMKYYEEFYSNPNTDFLTRYNISYIFYDKYEQQRFQTRPDSFSFCEKIYDDNETFICRVAIPSFGM